MNPQGKTCQVCKTFKNNYFFKTHLHQLSKQCDTCRSRRRKTAGYGRKKKQKKQQKKQPQQGVEDDMFEVEKILDQKTTQGKTRYKVRWKGYDATHDSWEPEENIPNTNEALQEYKSTAIHKKTKQSKRTSAKEKEAKVIENDIQEANDEDSDEEDQGVQDQKVQDQKDMMSHEAKNKELKETGYEIVLVPYQKLFLKNYPLRDTNNVANPDSKMFKQRFDYFNNASEVPKALTSTHRSFRRSKNDTIETKSWKRIIDRFCSQSVINCNKTNRYTFEQIYRQKGPLINFIINRYLLGELKLRTLAGNLNKVAVMLLYSNPFSKEVQKIVNNITSYANDIQAGVNKTEYGNNELTEEDHKSWVSYNELVKARNDLSPKFYTEDFGKKTIGLENMRKHLSQNTKEIYNGYPQKKSQFNTHFAFLMLAVNTYMPPLRREFADMIYIESDNEPQNKDTKQNYLWYHTPTKQYSIVLNHDKMTSRGKQKKDPDDGNLQYDNIKGLPSREIFPINQNNPFMQSDEMTKAFNWSFKIFKREYVFPTWSSCKPKRHDNWIAVKETKNGETRYPYQGNVAIGSSLHDLIHGLFGERKPGQNRIRQAYHTYFQRTEQLSNRWMKQIAARMRHSLEVGNAVYSKIDTRLQSKKINFTEHTHKPLDEEIVQRVNDLVNAKLQTLHEGIDKVQKVKSEKVKKNKNYQRKYQKAYRENGCYGVKRQYDNRYLGYLTSGKIKKPRKETLEKHGIEEHDGEYRFKTIKATERKKSENNCIRSGPKYIQKPLQI